LPDDDSTVALIVEPLAKHHQRAGFSCGIVPLDRYLKTQASQDAKRSVAAPFVAVTLDNTIAGYYTLSAFSVELAALPGAQARKLPKYPTLPATLLGRLAVDQHHHGQGMGEFLLVDALFRSYRASTEIASYAVVVDAKNDTAMAFYQHYDFVAFPDTPTRLFLPMNIIAKLF
jgi:GNAT superfamily N-acetyltransferase